MKIIYTLHALEQIKQRKIIDIWIEETIKYPDETQRDR